MNNFFVSRWVSPSLHLCRCWLQVWPGGLLPCCEEFFPLAVCVRGFRLRSPDTLINTRCNTRWIGRRCRRLFVFKVALRWTAVHSRVQPCLCPMTAEERPHLTSRPWDGWIDVRLPAQHWRLVTASNVNYSLLPWEENEMHHWDEKKVYICLRSEVEGHDLSSYSSYITVSIKYTKKI